MSDRPPRPGLARAVKAPAPLILLLGGLTAFGPISIDMYLPSLPSLARSLHASDADAQLTVAAFFIGISVGQLFYGPISDRYGRKPPLLFGLVLYLAATAGCALAPNIQSLLAFRVLQALGGCAGMVIARAVVRDLFQPEEVLHVFALLMLVMGLAPILAPLLGGFVLLFLSWRWIFGLQLLFALAMGTSAMLTLKESRSEATAAQARLENAFGAYRALLSNPRVVGYLLTGALSGAALFTYVSSSPLVVMGFYHIPAQAFGWVFGVNAIGLVGASQLNARLARRFSADAILSWANRLVTVVALVMVATAVTGFGGLWGVLIPLFLMMSGLGFNQANASAGALNVDPRRSGATAALVGATGFGVGAAAASLAGAFADGTPRPMALVIALSMLLASVSLQTLVLKPDALQPQPVR